MLRLNQNSRMLILGLYWCKNSLVLLEPCLCVLCYYFISNRISIESIWNYIYKVAFYLFIKFNCNLILIILNFSEEGPSLGEIDVNDSSSTKPNWTWMFTAKKFLNHYTILFHLFYPVITFYICTVFI